MSIAGTDADAVRSDAVRSGHAGSVTISTAAQQAPVVFKAFTNLLLS